MAWVTYRWYCTSSIVQSSGSCSRTAKTVSFVVIEPPPSVSIRPASFVKPTSSGFLVHQNRTARLGVQRANYFWSRPPNELPQPYTDRPEASFRQLLAPAHDSRDTMRVNPVDGCERPVWLQGPAAVRLGPQVPVRCMGLQTKGLPRFETRHPSWLAAGPLQLTTLAGSDGSCHARCKRVVPPHSAH